MAYTYHDYMSPIYTRAQKIERCQLFIAELTALIGPNISADGRSKDNTPILSLLEKAERDRVTLESDPRANRRGGTSRGLIF